MIRSWQFRFPGFNDVAAVFGSFVEELAFLEFQETRALYAK